jgi:hypothetical protein
MADPGSLVVIASHLRLADANVLRRLMEAEGLVAGIRDDAPADYPSVQAVGAVKLVVLPADARRALEMVWTAGVLPGEG